jgi:hypothetical protein
MIGSTVRFPPFSDREQVLGRYAAAQKKSVQSTGAAGNGASLAESLKVLVYSAVEQIGGKARAAF